MSDEELDRQWQPNGRRPQSTMARSFSQELMDIFRIENSISDLGSQVDQRKHQVLQSSDELASLEARLKEMEARLKKSQQAHNRMSMSHISTGAAGGSAGYARPGPPQHDAPPPPPPKDDDAASAKARSRPGTARATQQAPSSGNMPPTPGASEDGDRE